MAVLKDYYNTGGDFNILITGTQWITQTFTASSDYNISSVILQMQKTGTPYTLTVSIRATDVNGKPTGSDLAVGTTSGNTLPDSPSYEWREITFSTPASLTNGTKYAIVCRAAALGVRWYSDSTSPSYAGGSYGSSTNSGTSWSMNTGFDLMFETWGLVPILNVVGSCSAEGSITGFAFVNILPIAGSCSAEGALTGLAFVDVLPVIGSCSVETSMAGTIYVAVWSVVGSCSTTVGITGTAILAALSVVGGCSVEASLTGLAKIFLYVVGSMSAIADASIWIPSSRWPPMRWSDYDDSLTWDEEAREWVAEQNFGGGRYSIKLIVVGQGDANQGEIYFGGA